MPLTRRLGPNGVELYDEAGNRVHSFSNPAAPQNVQYAGGPGGQGGAAYDAPGADRGMQLLRELEGLPADYVPEQETFLDRQGNSVSEGEYHRLTRGGGGGGADEAQRAMMAQQGIQGQQDQRVMGATDQLLRHPGFQFGKGGGDWASAWTQAMQPRQGLFDRLFNNQVDAFTNYDQTLDRTFNSPSGPMGQFQAAAVQTAPFRAERDVAKMKLDSIGQLFDRLGVDKPLSPAAVETDYGAFARLNPVSHKKYMPGAK